MVEIGFVFAPGQNHFFRELGEAIRSELHDLGVITSVHLGGFPAARDDLVTLLMPPHEYFSLTDPDDRPSREQLARTIVVCAEQPGTHHFDVDLAIGALAGGVFDIQKRSVEHFKAAGVRAHQLPLGWTKAWCRSGGLETAEEPVPERDIDVLHLGIHSMRRAAAISGYGPQLERWRAHLQLGADDQPLAGDKVNAVFDDAKWELLGRSRTILNVHVAERPYFEWLRVIQAICNGAYVVTEHSEGIEPLVNGEHLTVGSAASLGLLAQPVLEDEAVRLFRARQAYHLIKREMPFSASVERLAEVAESVARRPARTPAGHVPHVPRFVPPVDDRFPSATVDPDASAMRQALKDIRLELSDMRRQMSRMELEIQTGRQVWAVELDEDTPAWATAKARVSIVTALFNYERHIEAALSSVARGWYQDIEFVIVDDASTDGSREAVRRFMRANPSVPVRLARHPVNRGLGPARNAALDFARGEFVFVLDADNLVYRHGLQRHVEALDADQEASFAYGIVGMFTGDGPFAVLSQYAWNPQRLRRGNYIDAMSMWRRPAIQALGGYVTDRRLWGWEDYDLWCRAADAGYTGAHVPEVLTRYRVARHSMLSLTNISASTAVSVLTERAPRLMRGVEPPL
jgi:hypothetical protein